MLQLLLMQGVLALMLAGLASLSRGDTRAVAFCLWTLLVPAGFAYVFGSAYLRHERAVREGAWSKEWAKRQDARGYSMLGGVFLAWIAGILAILVLL